MSRRVLGATAALTLFVAVGPSHAALGVAPPRVNCARILTDIEGDAEYTLSTTGSVKDPRDPAVDGVDITHAAVRVTAERIEVMLRVKNLNATFQPYETGYRYDVKFKNADGKQILFQTMKVNPAIAPTPAKPANADSYPRSEYAAPPATAVPFAGTAHEFDPAGKWVFWALPLAELAKAFSEPIVAGTVLTAITAETYAYIPGNGAATVRLADSATSTDPIQSTYTVGDDYCFGPPPASLTTTLTAPRVAFGDSIPLSATLKSETGEALAGKSVRFSVGGDAVSATTDANGVATATYTAGKTAGTHPLTISFAGDADHGKASVGGVDVTVLLEATKLGVLKSTRTSSTGRSVQTTLTDDDGKALAGQRIDWYVGTKKTTTTTTSSSGVAKWTGAKSGQSVVAKFAGLTGKYAPTSSKALRV